MRAAVIGAGRMGRRHVQVVKDLGLELAGVADPSPEARKLTEREQGVAPERTYAEADALLEQERPDCVVVATTAPTHCEYTIRAARAGARFVLCEKPMAVSLAECDHMIRTCEASGTRLAVNHQMRFMEQYTVPRDIVLSEAFGGLSSVTVVAGNFGMAMNGTHYFEMFRFMTGEAPDSVAAWFSQGSVPNPRGAQFEDRAGAVRLTTPSGKRLYIEIGGDQGHGVRVIYAGRLGQLEVDELAGRLRLDVRDEPHRSLPTTRYGMPSTVREWRIAPADAVAPTRAVLDALLREGDYPSGRDGRLAVAVLVAAHLSNERGHLTIAFAEAESAAERSFPWA